MAVSTRTVLVPAHGAGSFRAHVAVPPAGSGPGLLLVQEIFGLSEYLRGRAADLAALGYVVVVPDLYWRLEPGVAIDEAADGALEEGLAYRQRLDFPAAVDDAVATFEYMRTIEDVYRPVGVLGFCLGAGIAFGVAAHADPGAAVLYYGSDIAGQLRFAPDVRCPVLFQWGGEDDYVPEATRDEVAAAFAGRDDVETHVYPGAAHAFDNHRSPLFSRPEQAAAAWERTVGFLRRTMPVGHR